MNNGKILQVLPTGLIELLGAQVEQAKTRIRCQFFDNTFFTAAPNLR